MTRRGFTFGGGSGGGGGGAQTLTGDTTGTLSGTNIATTTGALQGNPVAAGVPATGTFLWWGGSSWAPSTLKWQSSTGVVAAAADTVVGLSQTTPASDVATVDLVLAPQAPFASATVNLKGGNARINLAAPVSGNGEAALIGFRGASPSFAMGVTPGFTPGSGIWFNAAANARTSGNATLYSNGTTALSATSGSIVIQYNGPTWLTIDGTNTYLGQSSSSNTACGGANTFIVARATTNPTSNPQLSGFILYGDNPDLNAKIRDSLGTVTAITPKTTGTVNTQAQRLLQFVQYGRLTTTGGTLTLSIPLATSLTNCIVNVQGLIKIATAGSLNAAGDTYGIDLEVVVKNVAGTLSIVGSSATLISGSDASLSGSSVVASVSGTNIVLTLTAVATSGTLGNADCTISAQQVIN